MQREVVSAECTAVLIIAKRWLDVPILDKLRSLDAGCINCWILAFTSPVDGLETGRVVDADGGTRKISKHCN
jgi:hypothetical protein